MGLMRRSLKSLKRFYTVAKNKHQERWTKDIRNWSFEDKLYLYPEREAKNVDTEENEEQAS